MSVSLKKDILILGAGPAALAALHCFRNSEVLHPTAFDPRPAATGLWHYDPLPTSKPQEQISPLYTNLNTNIPTTLMRYTNWDWPEDTVLFPDRTEVEKYLISYSNDVLEYIRFGCRVVSVWKEEGKRKWCAVIEEGPDQQRRRLEYDCVIMAGGNYAFPREIPQYPGFQEWLNAGGQSIHSKYYRDPNDYEGTSVLIVGAGASGIDIARQIAATAAKVFWSVRSPVEADESIHVVGEIERFVGDGGVVFNGGRTENKVDAIIWCIGYVFRRPELKVHANNIDVETPPGSRFKNLYEHIFYTKDTTLAFLGVPQKVIPFVITQSQAAVIRRVWEDRLSLPTESEMRKWEEDRVSQIGEGKYHQMPNLEDADYIERLYRMCKTSGVELADGECPLWGARERWLRSRLRKIKVHYEEEVAKGGRFTKVEELGYIYDGKEQDTNISTE